jgi:hypothetical protein
VLRDRKCEFERTKASSSAVRSFQKWIEWLWSLSFSQFISVSEKDTHWTMSNYSFRFKVLLSILSHFLESVARRSASTSRILFEPVVSAYRNFFHLSSTLTEFPLKNSYRSSPRLCFLLVNFNSSRIRAGLCWVMTDSAIADQLRQIFVNLDVFWKNGARRSTSALKTARIDPDWGEPKPRKNGITDWATDHLDNNIDRVRIWKVRTSPSNF